MLGSIDANRGDPQNGWDTDQFPNSVEDLAMPLYEILRAGGIAPGGFNFDAKLRRQSTDRDDLFHAHIGGLDTIARALLVAADLVERGDLAANKDGATRVGRATLAARSWTGDGTLTDLKAASARVSVPPVLRPAARSALRTSSTAASGPSTARTRSDVMGVVLGIDVSTTATKAILVDDLGIVRGIASAEYVFDQPRPLVGASRAPPPPKTRHSPAALANAGLTGDDVEAVGLTGEMHGLVLLDTQDEVIRPAILWNDQRTGAECDAIRAAVGVERLVALTGERCPDRVHRAQARMGARPRAPCLGACGARAPAQGLRPTPLDRHPCHGQSRRCRHPPVRPRRPRRVPETLGARHRHRLDAADVRGPGGDRHDHVRGRRGHRSACRNAGGGGRRRPGRQRRRGRRGRPRAPGAVPRHLGGCVRGNRRSAV